MRKIQNDTQAEKSNCIYFWNCKKKKLQEYSSWSTSPKPKTWKWINYSEKSQLPTYEACIETERQTSRMYKRIYPHIWVRSFAKFKTKHSHPTPCRNQKQDSIFQTSISRNLMRINNGLNVFYLFFMFF